MERRNCRYQDILLDSSEATTKVELSDDDMVEESSLQLLLTYTSEQVGIWPENVEKSRN